MPYSITLYFKNGTQQLKSYITSYITFNIGIKLYLIE